uniref:Uncharacterized protein n=1 Tax=Panagrolaimus sp. ES5 TaxID=591445 RepID=A0AC34FKS6_9BILA
MSKPGIRDSLVNMLGEFVGLQRNPEFRLSTSSEQFLADAIKEEKKASTCSITSSQGSLNIYIGMDPISHQRSNSTPIRRNYTKTIQDSEESRRLSDPINHQRSNSTPIRRNYTKTIRDSEESRRLSVPLLRPKLLLKRFKRHSGSYDPNPINSTVISTPRQNSIISESDEEILSELPKSKRTRNYSQSSSILGDLAKSGHVRCQPLMVSIH